MSWLFRLLKKSWITNPVLTMLIFFSAVCFCISAFGLAFDTRLINGEHGWIKPTKFSLSLTLYGLTLFWFSKFLTSHKTFFHRVCIAAFIGTVVELSAIIMQVLRGTTSHFNTATPFDHAVFWVTAFAITPIAFGILAIFCMLLREKNLPPVLGVALKWGVLLTLVGCVPGILMLLPDAVQDFMTHSKQFAGHTVGYSEGGPGLPFIGWSTVAGDLRAAHFLGIHALQVLPVVGYLVMKLFSRLSIVRQELLVGNVGIGYCCWIVLLTIQALSAESISSPSYHTLLFAAIIMALSLILGMTILLAPPLTVPKKWSEAED